MQLDLPLHPQPRASAAFATEADFIAALAQWQSGESGRAGPLRATRVETPLGVMVCIASSAALFLLEFADRPELARETLELARAHGVITPGRTAIAHILETQLQGYFSERLRAFDVPLALTGSDFAQDVWTRLQTIPYGVTTSYGALAAQMGRPSASRAVARANGANRIAILVPCHRVIGADGTLTGYAGGLERKRALLALETRVATAPQ